VAESAGDGTKVDASGEQLGRGVMAEGMQVAVDTDLSAHARIAVADLARVLEGILKLGYQSPVRARRRDMAMIMAMVTMASWCWGRVS
jgi:hypothetical protein